MFGSLDSMRAVKHNEWRELAGQLGVDGDYDRVLGGKGMNVNTGER